MLNSNIKTIPLPVHNFKGIVIGHVNGDYFEKRVKASIHMLRKPPSWACDVCALEEAKSKGATYLFLHDIENGINYLANIDYFWFYGKLFNRGCGNQRYLPLGYWKKALNGQPKSFQMILPF